MVSINVKQSNKYEGFSAFISFPYDIRYVNLMRAQPKRYWHSDIKSWEVPYENLSLVIDKLSNEDYKLVIDENVNKAIESQTDVEIPSTYKFKTNPFSHQIDGIKYGLNHNKFLLGDEQGCVYEDGRIFYTLNGNGNYTTLGHLYELYTAMTENDELKVRCFKGHRFGTNKVNKVVFSGYKLIYRLTLESKFQTYATIDHEVLTTTGFVELGKLRLGDDVIVYQGTAKVIGVEEVGFRNVYDIVMEEPYRNFVVDNIVVHNCGKSKTLIDLACIKKDLYGYEHCLVIACVNGLKYNWQEEVSTHSNESGYILGTRINKKGKATIGSKKDRLEDLNNLDNIKDYFIITNIETLRYTVAEKVECKTKNKNGVKRYKKITRFPIVEKLQELIRQKKISMIVVDEIHRCKDSTSLQGRALLSLNAETMAALTGTPLMNNAIDLYTPLKFLGIENHSLFAFKSHYCIMCGFGGHQIVGYKNLPELQGILDKCMLRRLKKDVLDLPEKIYFTDYVEMTPSQTKIYNSILEDLRQNIDKVKLSPNPLTMLIRLRQATGEPSMLSTEAKGNPKFDRLLEIMEDIVADGKKAIVFSNWTAVLNPAYELLKEKGYQPALYSGENKDTREEDKNRFKTDNNCKVICGTIGAMGTGLTLTEATTVIFLDEPWNRAIKDQAEDRAHRIGTTEHLNVITIMCKDTIDEKIHNMVYRKGKMSDIIVDKEEDLFRNPNVINYLLS